MISLFRSCPDVKDHSSHAFLSPLDSSSNIHGIPKFLKRRPIHLSHVTLDPALDPVSVSSRSDLTDENKQDRDARAHLSPLKNRHENGFRQVNSPNKTFFLVASPARIQKEICEKKAVHDLLVYEESLCPDSVMTPLIEKVMGTPLQKKNKFTSSKGDRKLPSDPQTWLSESSKAVSCSVRNCNLIASRNPTKRAEKSLERTVHSVRAPLLAAKGRIISQDKLSQGLVHREKAGPETLEFSASSHQDGAAAYQSASAQVAAQPEAKVIASYRKTAVSSTTGGPTAVGLNTSNGYRGDAGRLFANHGMTLLGPTSRGCVIDPQQQLPFLRVDLQSRPRPSLGLATFYQGLNHASGSHKQHVASSFHCRFSALHGSPEPTPSLRGSIPHWRLAGDMGQRTVEGESLLVAGWLHDPRLSPPPPPPLQYNPGPREARRQHTAAQLGSGAGVCGARREDLGGIGSGRAAARRRDEEILAWLIVGNRPPLLN